MFISVFMINALVKERCDSAAVAKWGLGAREVNHICETMAPTIDNLRSLRKQVAWILEDRAPAVRIPSHFEPVSLRDLNADGFFHTFSDQDIASAQCHALSGLVVVGLKSGRWALLSPGEHKIIAAGMFDHQCEQCMVTFDEEIEALRAARSYLNVFHGVPNDRRVSAGGIISITQSATFRATMFLDALDAIHWFLFRRIPGETPPLLIDPDPFSDHKSLYDRLHRSTSGVLQDTMESLRPRLFDASAAYREFDARSRVRVSALPTANNETPGKLVPVHAIGLHMGDGRYSLAQMSGKPFFPYADIVPGSLRDMVYTMSLVEHFPPLSAGLMCQAWRRRVVREAIIDDLMLGRYSLLLNRRTDVSDCMPTDGIEVTSDGVRNYVSCPLFEGALKLQNPPTSAEEITQQEIEEHSSQPSRSHLIAADQIAKENPHLIQSAKIQGNFVRLAYRDYRGIEETMAMCEGLNDSVVRGYLRVSCPAAPNATPGINRNVINLGDVLLDIYKMALGGYRPAISMFQVMLHNPDFHASWTVDDMLDAVLDVEKQEDALSSLHLTRTLSSLGLWRTFTSYKSIDAKGAERLLLSSVRNKLTLDVALRLSPYVADQFLQEKTLLVVKTVTLYSVFMEVEPHQLTDDLCIEIKV